MGNLGKFVVLFAAASFTMTAEPRISLLVYNFAGVPRAVLREAEAEAYSVLRVPGIELEFIECSVDPASPGPSQVCMEEPRPSVLVLHILPAGTSRHQAGVNALGFATVATDMGFSCYAGVFYDRIAQIAPGPHAAALLGHVMAHEIGHLLLGPGRHSDAGIMKTKWYSDYLALPNLRRLQFGASERRLLINNVRLRTGEVGATPRP